MRERGTSDRVYWICAFAVNQHAGIFPAEFVSFHNPFSLLGFLFFWRGEGGCEFDTKTQLRTRHGKALSSTP